MSSETGEGMGKPGPPPRSSAQQGGRGRRGWRPVDDSQLSPGLGKELRRRLDEEEREYEREVQRLMARQRRLSLTAGGFLFLLVGGFTAATFLAPDFMSRPVWHGFSPALLFAAVIVYPLTWVVGLLYTIRANKLDGLG